MYLTSHSKLPKGALNTLGRNHAPRLNSAWLARNTAPADVSDFEPARLAGALELALEPAAMLPEGSKWLLGHCQALRMASRANPSAPESARECPKVAIEAAFKIAV